MHRSTPPDPISAAWRVRCGGGRWWGQIPYSLIFAGASCDWDSSSVLNFAFDTFFITDIAVNFNTAFIDDFAAIVRDHAAIANQYLRPALRPAHGGAFTGQIRRWPWHGTGSEFWTRALYSAGWAWD